ncbi:MAG: polysaccharide biosynthesis/export family protein [Bdellovibrionota bacterium]
MKTNFKYIAVLIAVAIVSQGCSTIPSLPSGKSRSKNAPSLAEGFLVEDTRSEIMSSKTEVRPGYQIQMTSTVDDKLSGQVRVELNGELKLPYGGSVQAAGLSVQALSDKINAELRKFYKADPQVSIRISDRKYLIEVRGLVQKPGVILVSEFEKVENIIKKSGELSLAKEARVVQIVRGQNSFYIDLEEYFQGRDMNLSPKWYGGEKVFFIQATTALGEENSASVQILGDLRNPGAMAFKDGANLYQYITKAGGPTQTSDLDRVQVIRQTANGPVVTEGTAEEIAQHIKLEAGDTVFMGSSNASTTERIVQMGASIASILSVIAIFIIAF